jgi:RHS repeat-associated protein
VYACTANNLCSAPSNPITITVKCTGAICNVRAVKSAYVSTYVHTDQLGSPIAETDAAGVVKARFRYEPYGQSLEATINQGPGYTGHVTDPNSGLIYMQARYYDPMIGRFLSTDPARSEFNLYNYGSNNPYTYVDPDGRRTRIIVNLNGGGSSDSSNGGSSSGSKSSGSGGSGHSAIFVERGFDGDPILYDPAGAFGAGGNRGTGGFFTGEGADLVAFLKFQLTDGPEVFVFDAETTVDEEKIIGDRILDQGDPSGGFCTQSVCEVAKGVGPFSDLGNFWLPRSLADHLSDQAEIEQSRAAEIVEELEAEMKKEAEMKREAK